MNKKIPLLFLFFSILSLFVGLIPANAQSVGTTQTYQSTQAVPYVNPFFFTMSNATIQYLAVEGNDTAYIYSFDANNNPKINSANFTYTFSEPSVYTYTSKPITVFASDNSLYLYMWNIYFGSQALFQGNTSFLTGLKLTVVQTRFDWNSTDSSWSYGTNSTVINGVFLVPASNDYASYFQFAYSAISTVDQFGTPTVILTGYHTRGGNNVIFPTNHLLIYLTPTLATYNYHQEIAPHTPTPIKPKAILYGVDSTSSVNRICIVSDYMSSGYYHTEVYNVDTSTGTITSVTTTIIPFSYTSYYTTAQTANLGNSPYCSFQALFFYPSIIFENVDANNYRLIFNEWLVETATGNTALTHYEITLQRSGSTVGTNYYELLVVNGAFPPISKQVLVSAIGSTETIREYIWNSITIQYATYTRDLSSNTYSFQGWTQISLPSGWTYPSWVTRYYIWSTQNNGFKLLSYFVPFTAISGYNPPQPITSDNLTGTFGISTSLVMTIIVPFLILFLPPLLLAMFVGKTGFLVGLGLTLAVGTMVGIVPTWMIFLVGIGLVLLLYERFGRGSNSGEEG